MSMTMRNLVNDTKKNFNETIQVSDALGLQKRLVFLPHVQGNPYMDLQDQGVIDSGCSRYMTGNMSYLTDFEEINGGYVAFGGNPKGGKITGKDHLGNFDGKADEGFFVGYSINSKAFSVFNSRTRIVEENLHVQFSENTPNIAGSRPNCLFDIDALTKSMNYKPVITGNQSNGNAGTKACDDAGDNEKKVTEEPMKEGGGSSNDQEKEDDNVNNTNNVNTASDGNKTNNVNVVSSTVNAAGIEVNVVGSKTSIELPDDPNMPELEDIIYLDDAEDVGAKADMNNLNTFMPVSPILTTRIHKDHPIEQIIGDLNSAPQTRRMTKNLKEHEEPKKVIHALKDPSWIEAIQDELLQFKLQKVWTLVDLPNGKRAIGTKWVFRNKKDERGIVIKNKARLVAQAYTQEEWIDYDEVFAPVSRIESTRLFLAYALFKDFMMYKMDVKSAFIYGKIEEEVYVCQPPRFEDPDFLNRVYKVEKALYGLHQAPRAWYETLSTYLLDNGFQRGKIDKTLFIRRDKGDILFTYVKTASTPMETQKPLLKDEDGEESDVHLYRSMIRSLMYLTSSRPVIILISWVCKKQNVVANSITEAEYLAASSCCGQVLWIQNQLLDYGDSNKKKLIQMIKIHTDKNVADFLIKAFDATIKVKMVNEEQQLQVLVDGKKIVDTEASVRRDLQLDDEEATNQKFNFFKYIFKSMVKNLDNAGKFLMYPRRSKRKDSEVPQPSNPTNVADEAVNEEPTQAQKITSLKKRVKKLEKKGGLRNHKLKRLYKVGLSARVESTDEASLGVPNSKKDDAAQVSTTSTKVSTASTIPPSESITTTITIPSKDKGKGIMVEEPAKMKKKDQISFDEQEAIRLQAEFDEEVRLTREKDEANVALTKEWNDIQAKIEADQLLAERLKAREQEELTIEERAKLF
ncbi:putative ribonuclease H-like domain-containing protein [Tanacetum coccineum]